MHCISEYTRTADCMFHRKHGFFGGGDGTSAGTIQGGILVKCKFDDNGT